MKILVALAVMGLCSALPQQAYNSYGSSPAGSLQPKWKGPFASSEPAGINGIIPVSDTREVSNARNTFLRAYDRQLADVAAARREAAAAARAYPRPATPAPSYRSAPAPAFSSAPAPANRPASTYSRSAFSHLPVQDTPEVAAAKSEFFNLYNQQAAAAAAAPDVNIITSSYY